MREQHQTAEWEEYFKIIDLLGEGEFIAVRRWVSGDRILYEGYCWDAAKEEKKAAYLDVRLSKKPTIWIDAMIVLRRYEIYENVKSGTLYLFIFDGDGNIEFHATYTDPVELHWFLRFFHSTGTTCDLQDFSDEESGSARVRLQRCREESDRFFLIADHRRTYLRERYAFLQKLGNQQNQ